MESTSSVMTLAYRWQLLSCSLQAMTKKENHSSCQPALKGLCEKTLEAPFSQECLLNKIMRVNRKQMCMFSSSAAVCDVHTTCEGTVIWCCCWSTNRKRKWNTAQALLSANTNCSRAAVISPQSHIKQFRLLDAFCRWPNPVVPLFFVRRVPP